MSTSLLYHGFGIRGYRHVRTEYIEGGVVFTIVQDPKRRRCPACGGKNTILKGGVVRRFRGLPIGSKKATFVFRVPRVRRRDCHALRQTPIAFADPRRTYTRSFAQYVLELARMMTIRDVALHLGVRWLLLKRAAHLDASRHEHQRLEEALRLNVPLATAYYLKEELGEFWEQDDQEEAEAFLLDWILRAESSGIRMLHPFARTLRFHAHGLLAYYDYAISTGPLEGANNKSKTMKRQAYGFRDHPFFILKIYAIHESRYALVG
jgi:transposase